MVSVLKMIVTDHLQTLSNDTCSVGFSKIATTFIRLAGCLECSALSVSKGLLLLA